MVVGSWKKCKIAPTPIAQLAHATAASAPPSSGWGAHIQSQLLEKIQALRMELGVTSDKQPLALAAGTYLDDAAIGARGASALCYKTVSIDGLASGSGSGSDEHCPVTFAAPVGESGFDQDELMTNAMGGGTEEAKASQTTSEDELLSETLQPSNTSQTSTEDELTTNAKDGGTGETKAPQTTSKDELLSERDWSDIYLTSTLKYSRKRDIYPIKYFLKMQLSSPLPRASKAMTASKSLPVLGGSTVSVVDFQSSPQEQGRVLAQQGAAQGNRDVVAQVPHRGGSVLFVAVAMFMTVDSCVDPGAVQLQAPEVWALRRSPGGAQMSTSRRDVHFGHVTWFDERLGSSPTWAQLTKNTFIEFDDREDAVDEDCCPLRRERSAPARAAVVVASGARASGVSFADPVTAAAAAADETVRAHASVDEEWADDIPGNGLPPDAVADGQDPVVQGAAQPPPLQVAAQPLPPAARPPAATSLDDVAKVVRVLVTKRHDDGQPVVLESATSLAARLGLHMSHFRLKVYAAARAAHCAARAHVDRLIRGTLAACRQAPGQDGGSKGDVINAALRHQLDSPLDPLIETRFPRQLDVVGCDAASGNLRSERAMGYQYPFRSQLLLLCRAHMKKKVAEQGYKTIQPFDTHLVRCQMSLVGDHVIALRHEARRLHEEQVIILHGVCPESATTHRRKIWDMYFDDPTDPTLMYRRAICQRLYNGDIRKHGVVEHYCNGCCRSPAHTVFLMRRYGVGALFGGVDVMNRANWTNKLRSHRTVGLPASVHGLFQAAYLRALPAPKRAGAPAPPPPGGGARGGGDGPPAAPPVGEGEGPPQGGLGAGDPAGEHEADADDGNTFSEEQAARVLGSRAWMLGGTVEDDMYVASSMVVLTDSYVTKQLHTSGSAFEQQQQQHVAAGRPRTYQAWLAHEDADAISILTSSYNAIFDARAWDPLQCRTEAAGLSIYRLYSRMGAVAYHLVYRSNRNWPMPLLYASKDATMLGRLGSTKPCLLDAYSANFASFYAGRLGSTAAMAELKGAVSVIDIDTADVERMHSVNQRGARFRVWTHVETVEEVSAHFATHSAADFGVAAASRPPGCQRAAAPKRMLQEGGPPRGRNSVKMWAWRTFVHMRGSGFLTRESAAELSEQYRALSDDEFQQYRLLGALARDQHLAGLRSFPKRRRAAAASASSDAGGVIGLLPSSRGRRDLPLGDGELRKLAYQESGDDMFALVDTAATVEGDIDVQVDAGRVLRYRRRAECVAADACQGIRGSCRQTVGQLASEWEDMHRTYTMKNVPHLGKVPTCRRRCHEAETCICEGEGAPLRRLEAHVRSAFAALRRWDKKAAKAALARGDSVLRFTSVVRPPSADAEADGGAAGALVPLGDGGGATTYRFFHVAFHYSKPFAPTVVELERDPTRDRGDILGVLPKRTGDPTTFWRSTWEMVKSFESGPHVTISFWQFVGARRHVVSVEPWKLWISNVTAEVDPPPERWTHGAFGQLFEQFEQFEHQQFEQFELCPPLAAEGLAAPRGFGKVPPEIVAPCGNGVIRYYATTGVMVAQCGVRSHQVGHGCFLTRSCRAMGSNKSKGRMLGLFAAWLELDDSTMVTRWEHVHLYKPAHRDRLVARQAALASGSPLLLALASKERDENDNDVEGEPLGDP
ncbi:unnamed protein product [Prorocentrum cordatum]|uniref:Uncharacterized protein n=1 Tax=Prorocentrum cordatum TaxID=2364126 RepID=A0ABN9USB9_9DINO|nr:unnamed protein product [Polarella glacialis]